MTVSVYFVIFNNMCMNKEFYLILCYSKKLKVYYVHLKEKSYVKTLLLNLTKR